MTTKNKQKQISIRLTDEEYSKIYVLSGLEHMNPTQYVKQKALTKTRPIIIKNVELIEKLQRENKYLKEEQAEVKFELIERLIVILRLRTP
ncbi:TPA: hypothetical protein R1902_002420 [Staphylococcus delphini]|uniref:hypothetical protein n=1 Tax=Staphylococcus pseudintermedius TaxID=283734 RepID=UPI0025608CA5|nr:hypothetical protein [Staphylococcus pseudintermedius]HBB6316702.1 hypothetical protein [Escherichia coli]HEC2146963.1 hypothetical protein [Staphylococcus delphini]EHL7231843.1 hypothetical protein [Staphylococcus pseudintermedius]MDK3612081.1 hypothetical protein [Staphylococcus pseudintermedius]HCA7066765.1 hypothetical protein [Staphylococcus pseudintermedius]